MPLYRTLLLINGGLFCQQSVVQFLKADGIFLQKLNKKCQKKNFSTTLIKNIRPQVKKSRGIFKTPIRVEENFENFENAVPPHFTPSLLYKPFVFAIVFSCGSIAAAAIWQYENFHKKAATLLRKNWFSDQFITYEKKKYNFRQNLSEIWNQLTEGEKIFVPICFTNILVFFAWKVKKFQPAMLKYFCSSPYSKAVCWPMVLTTFSHCNLFHLSANMYVLYTFSTSAVQELGKEQFLGLYLAGGVLSSFSSFFYKIIASKPHLSIGASGAVMAILAYICVKHPDAKLSIILLPAIVFSAGTGIKYIMALDVIGTLRGWTFFDHAAHLGGALSGIAWCYWGNFYIWQKRQPLLEWWHEIRTFK